MDPGSLSRTSQAVALTRAGMSLLIYLDVAVIARLLTALRSRAADRSGLAASVSTHPAGRDSAQVAAAANAGRRHGDTEPWLTILPAPDYLRLLAGAGWQAQSHADPRAGGAGEGRSLLVAARPGPARTEP